MYVLLRKEMPELRLLLEGRGYETVTMPGGAIYGSPRALMLVHPSLTEIAAESMAISYADTGTALVVIVEECEVFLVSVLFPRAIVLSCASATLYEDILMVLSGRYVMEERRAPLLTDPEKRLLYQLSYGITNKELAKRLMRSERTVRRLKESLYEKTGLVSSEQLMLYSLFSVNIRSS